MSAASRVRRTVTALVAACLAAGLLGSAPAASASTPGRAAATTDVSGYTPVMVVMDTSGSMQEPARSGGVPKIDAARAAVNAVASAVGRNQQLGVIAYPGSARAEPGSSCSPGDVVAPLGAPDPGRIAAAVRRLEADGNTPTSAALEHAGALLTASGAQVSVAVLVSDGQANCGPPVCETAKKLLAQGVHVTINTVGFDIASDAGAQEDLRCVAEATGGTYRDAGDALALQEALLRAAASYLELTAQVPATVSAVTGTAAGLGTDATLTVTNTGQQQASDVQVSLDFAQGKRSAMVPIDKAVQFVGNLAPGAARTLTFRLRPTTETVGSTLSWLAAATTADGRGAQASGQTKVLTPGAGRAGVLAVAGPVVVLGDSYSSGEGAGDYLTGDAGGPPGSRCHRSAKAYAAVLFGAERVTNLACSGAVTSQYGLFEQVSAGTEVELQSRQLRSLLDGKHPPALVMMTFGGNDIGFSEIVKYCAAHRDCGNDWGTATISRVRDVAGSLTSVYEQVDAAVNSPAAIARRGGRAAPIVVLPYVRVLPVDDAQAPGNCFFGFSGAEVKFMNRLLNKLNDTIHAAVQAQADAGRPFYYAEDVIDAFQPDHTVCDAADRQHANTYKIGSFDTATTDAIRLALMAKLDPARAQELVHPNAAGYAGEAQALAGWSQHTPVRPVTGKPLWDPLPISDHPLPGGIDVGAGQLQPAGGTITVQGSGFDPGSPVLVRLQSVPRTVGEARAGSDGTVRVAAPIPYTTSAGAHHVVLVGFAPDGTDRQVSQRVWVLPQLTAVALLVLLLGALLVGYWLWTWPRARRDRAGRGCGEQVPALAETVPVP